MKPLSQTTPRAVPLPAALQLWVWMMLIGALLSGVVAVHEMAHSRYHEISSLPHRLDDFMAFWHRMPLVHTEAFLLAPDGDQFGSGWGYPAPAIWIYRVFYTFDAPSVLHPKRGVAAMEIIALAATLFAGWRFFLALRSRGLLPVSAFVLCAVAAGLSWPLLFGLQRGNIEVLLWLPVAAAVWAFSRRRYTLAAVLIGVVAAAKIYPLILLALFLPSRRFGQIALAITLTVVITLSSLWYIGPTLPFALHHLGLGVSGFLQTHGAGINWNTEGFNHSFFHQFKVAAEQHGAADTLPHLLPLYMIVAGVGMTLLYLLRVVRLPLLNQLTVLTIAMVALPPTSYDYTLQVLFIPWVALALLAVERSARGLPPLRSNTAAITLLALLLAPELFLVHGTYAHSGTLRSFCLAALLALACIVPWPGAENASPDTAPAL